MTEEIDFTHSGLPAVGIIGAGRQFRLYRAGDPERKKLQMTEEDQPLRIVATPTTVARAQLVLPAQRALVLVALLSCMGFLAPPVRGSATPTAQFNVEFDATWSAQTHPLSFPPGPHFSPLIGGTHNSSIHFWAVGELASQGIQDMAERGRTTPLDLEVQAAI